MTTIDLSTSAVEGTSPGLSAYVARPAGSGPWPGVVVVHEAFAVDDVMRRHADRLASAGFLAILPDLFSAGGPVRCLVATMRAMRSGTGRAYADIEAGRQWLAKQQDCTGKTGVIGFCLGGGFALMVANRGFEVCAPNYAFLPKDLDAALDGACPVVASYGGSDRGLRGAAATLEAGLEKAGVPYDVKEYPAAGHSFLNDELNGPRPLRPLIKAAGGGPHPESAADAWPRIESFFHRYLD
jgi:carboxymethylenebutenolidase